MNCCQCQGVESVYSKNIAQNNLKTYREQGPSKTTSILLNALKSENIQGASLLDIGGGVGVIQHELLKAGLQKAVHVDASTAYLEAAKEESEAQGFAENVQYHHGDFVALAPTVESVDIVTLDRVICCYHDMESLVGLSIGKAQQLYGLVFPRETWWMALGCHAMNGSYWIRRNPYRFFIHSSKAVDGLVRDMGFQRQFYQKTFYWQIALYAR